MFDGVSVGQVLWLALGAFALFSAVFNVLFFTSIYFFGSRDCNPPAQRARRRARQRAALEARGSRVGMVSAGDTR